MTGDDVAALRARLAGLTGAARTRPLMELGQLMMARYWRVGAGQPMGLPDLTAGIDAMAEAYGYLDPHDVYRARMAAGLGWLLGIRHLAHAGSVDDRETGISRLDEAVALATLPPVMEAAVLVVLAQLYLSRVSGSLQSDDYVRAAMRGGANAGAVADVDRAVACIHRVLEAPHSAEIERTARTMLTMAEAMRTILSGFGRGLGGFDLGRMMEAVAALQTLQQQADAGRMSPSGSALPPMPSIFDGEKLANSDQLDRPVPVVHGTDPDAAEPGAAETVGVARAERAAAVVDRETMRRATLELLSELVPGDDPLAVMALLHPDAPLPTVDAVDELVARATTTVHSGESADPVVDGTDSLVLAVALHLRARRGGAGAPDDARAAAENLAAAVRAFPSEHPAAARLRVVAEHARGRSEPDPAELATALTVVGAAALVRLCPVDGDEDMVDVLLSDATTGLPQPLGTVPCTADAIAGAVLGRLGGAARRVLVTAGSALSQPALSLSAGSLAGLSLAGARTGAGRWLAEDLVVSYVASAADLVRLAGRAPLAVGRNPVFVANPRGDREWATIDAMVLRRLFYPRSTGLGRLVEDIDGTATPAEFLAHLDASLMSVDCGLRDTATPALELAGDGVLDTTAIRAYAWDRPNPAAGGLAILPPEAGADPCRYAALADTLLAAAFTGVIGWHWQVVEPVAALMLFVLHTRLSDDGLPPAQAVGSVHRWMLDPDREAPPNLPARCAAVLAGADLRDPRHWAALNHRGR